MTVRCVRDLKLAADFVKSVETGDTLVNFELRELAAMIEGVALRLDLASDVDGGSDATTHEEPKDAA